MHSLCTRVSLERNCQSRHGRQLFCAGCFQWQHGRETKSSSARNGRIVCSPPSNLRATRKMWSAGARLLRVFRLFSFWVLAAAVAAAAVAAHFRMVNDVYSGAVTLHTIRFSAELLTFFVFTLIRFLERVLRRTFFICRSISFLLLFTALSVVWNREHLHVDSSALHHRLVHLCPSDIDAMQFDAQPLCDCLSRRCWILIVLRIAVIQMIEQSNSSERNNVQVEVETMPPRSTPLCSAQQEEEREIEMDVGILHLSDVFCLNRVHIKALHKMANTIDKHTEERDDQVRKLTCKIILRFLRQINVCKFHIFICQWIVSVAA